MHHAFARQDFGPSVDKFILTDLPGVALTQQRHGFAKRFTSPDAVVSEPLRGDEVVAVYCGNFVTARPYRAPMVRRGTELCFTLVTAAGPLHLCTRYAWELSAYDVGLYLRAVMSRHEAIER